MSLRDLVKVSLLLGVGLILHLIIPGFAAGMKPDLLLGVLFIILFMKRDLKLALVTGAVAGLLCALTTTFPAGQIPNIVDKIATSFVLYFLIEFLFLIKIPKTISLGIVSIVGTLFSGSVFLLTALFFVNLPAPFPVLFATTVLPASILNTVVVLVLYPIVGLAQNVVSNTKPKAIK